MAKDKDGGAKPLDEETPFARFDRAVHHILSVPKTEMDRRQAEWQKQQKAKREKRGLPPGGS